MIRFFKFIICFDLWGRKLNTIQNVSRIETVNDLKNLIYKKRPIFSGE